MGEQGADPGVGPFADLLGVRRTLMAGGRSRFEVTLGSQHLNPHGVVHGGVVYTLVDYAMGGALTSRLTDGERCATIEIKINYVAPVSGGRLAAEARVIERTRRIGVLEARVEGDGGALIALATGTFYIQSGRS
jgi:acyl-CoA thioesterase